MINDDLDDKKNMLQVSLVFAVPLVAHGQIHIVALRYLQYGLWV